MNLNLQPLFPDKILEQHLLPEQHVGQASYVWRVATANERRIVRTTRVTHSPSNEFWWGCRELFGIDPSNVFAMTSINETLRQHARIAIPAVIRQQQLASHPLLVVEELPGQTIRSFMDLPTTASFQLGCALASIHEIKNAHCGNFEATVHYPTAAFPSRMAAVMDGLLAQFYRSRPDIYAAGANWVRAAAGLPAPTHAVPILLDIDPTQFLTDGRDLTALVDTEGYAYGPAVYDLVALEYLLDGPRAHAFARGYETRLALPKLADVRPVYRFLQRLMELQGAVEIDSWMGHPTWFD